MNSARMLRIASTLIIIVGLGHLVGHMMGMDTSALPDAQKRVTEAMQGYEFDAGGWKRTYWGFFVGFSASYSVFAFALGLLGFQAARLGAANPASLRGALVVVTAASAILAVLCFRYLVLPPTVMLGLAALCGLVGIAKAR
jgi:hypothetical protein